MKLATAAALNRMTPLEIAREHISWCRLHGYSPIRVYRDLDLLPPNPSPTWDDVRDEIVNCYRFSAYAKTLKATEIT